MEWIRAMEAGSILGVHWRSALKMAREGQIVSRHAPLPGFPNRFVVEFDRASVEERAARMIREAPPEEVADWMPIAEAQKQLKMTRFGIKRRMKLGVLEWKHFGPPEQLALYVSRKQIEEHLLEPPAYVRRTEWPTPTAKELEWAWLAGFFDGEGCVQICHRTQKRGLVWVLTIGIVNTYLPVMDRIAAMLGGRHWNKIRHSPKHKPCRYWSATGDEAQAVLKGVRPYLCVKHLQADLGIEFQDRLRSKRWGRWAPLTEDEMEWRNEAHEKMRLLNLRGPQEPKQSGDI